MIKLLLFLSLIFAFSHAKITLDEIKSKPAGRTKNFMIWQYLKQDIKSYEADIAYSLVSGKIPKITKLYLKKSTNKSLEREIRCRGKRDLLSIKDDKCFKLALTPYKTLSLDDKEREQLLKRVKNKRVKNIVKIQAEPYSLKHFIRYDSETILTMFVSTTNRHRRNNLNLNLSESFLNHMFNEQSSSWKKFTLIKKIINDKKLKNLQKSLLKYDGVGVNSDSNFLLGLNQLRYSNIDKAIKNFDLAIQKAKKQSRVDKNRFWQYLATKNKKYLRYLLLSSDINIYTLYAHDVLGEDFHNYFSKVITSEKYSDKNICDPFVWNEIVKEIKQTPKNKLLNLSQKYNQKDMAPVQAYIIERAYEFKRHAYIMPYDEYLKDLSIDEKALIYALMRQESRLIPSALSRSFALGLMQIMPFVADDLSKRIDNPISCYNDMFKPSYNLRYAIKHIRWLKKSFYHPLFIAYAYNGGAGFLRKHLKYGAFSKGKYEPFMSMELMSNSESREYGKKVLANYVMYKKILKEEVSIEHLLSILTNPKKTDRYR
jgi:soluble lytic murein transglycosylase